uniref:Cystatin domain-containing protein n=1 Tax=Panagrellus redivivus TaxID=6233 RepID=A0A7E4ZQ87_PANRE
MVHILFALSVITFLLQAGARRPEGYGGLPKVRIWNNPAVDHIVKLSTKALEVNSTYKAVESDVLHAYGIDLFAQFYELIVNFKVLTCQKKDNFHVCPYSTNLLRYRVRYAKGRDDKENVILIFLKQIY